MTRNEFFDEVHSWPRFFSVCYDMDYYFDDVIPGDELDERIDNDLRDLDDASWQEVKEYLNDIEGGYDAYRNDGWLDYVWLDDDSDLDAYMSDFVEWMDNRGYWDEEDEEDEEYPDVEDDDVVYPVEPEIEPESIPIEDLMKMCSQIHVLGEKENKVDMPGILLPA